MAEMQPPMASAQADPGQPGDTDEGQGGYEICIRVADDGSLTVGTESAADEAAEAQGGTDDEANYKPARDIKDALTQALAIYKADGHVEANDSADSEFDGGFANRGGSSPAY